MKRPFITYASAAVVLLSLLALVTSYPALAGLTLNSGGISSSGAIDIDGPGALSIGTSSATGVSIGRANQTVNLPGKVNVGGDVVAGNVGGTTWYFANGINGAVCDGATDDTNAFNGLISTVYNAGGGTIYVRGTCLILGAVVFPNDGAASPKQVAMRITGAGSSANGYWGVLPASPSALDLRYNASVAKLDTRGAGLLEIDHITLKDGGSDCAPFIHTTNTTLNIHDTAFSGTAAGLTACNDAIILGGTAANVGGSSDDAFQGYHTIITQNFFDKVRRMALLQTYANNIWITYNTYSSSSGNALVNGAAIELNAPASSTTGNIIQNNLFEVPYVYYGIRLVRGPAIDNVIQGNGCYDGSTNFIACVRFESGNAFNFAASNFASEFPQVSEGGSGNTVIDHSGNGASVFPSALGYEFANGEAGANKISSAVGYVSGWKLFSKSDSGSATPYFSSGATPSYGISFSTMGGASYTPFTVSQAAATQTHFVFGAAGNTDTLLNGAAGSEFRLRVSAGNTLWLGDSSTIAVQLGSDSTTTNNRGGLRSQSFAVGGTKFTAEGCSVSALVGGATAGRFVSGTTGTCTVTITMGGSQVASSSWTCWANNLTTPANTIHQTAGDTTTVTLSGATSEGDTINFGCVSY